MVLRVPSDVIKNILGFLGQRTRFPADIPKINKVFYELSQDKDIEILFKDFVFDTNKMYPTSPTIQFAFDRLQNANLLACINPELTEFEVTESLAKENTTLTLFDENETILLKGAADKFGELIKV